MSKGPMPLERDESFFIVIAATFAAEKEEDGRHFKKQTSPKNSK